MHELMKRIKLIDERVFEAMLDRRHPSADRLMRMLTHLGGAPFAILFVGLMMTFRIGRFFFPRPGNSARVKTTYVDAWTEAGRRLDTGDSTEQNE